MSDVGAGIGGVAQGAGTVLGAQATAAGMENQAKIGLQGIQEQLAEQARQFNTTNTEKMNAYQAALQSGGTQMKAGENDLTAEAGSQNPEIGQMEGDIATNNAKMLQQGAGQMGANLAMQGVRGGQAATLLNRGTGEQAINAQQDINKMKFQDAATKQNLLMAYNAAKAGAGQRATLPSFGGGL